MKKTIVSILFASVVLFFGCKERASNNQPVKSKRVPDEENLIEKGKEVSMVSFYALSGELQKAMKNGGIDNALRYCNTNALSITDSLSNVYNAKIKRTSLKVRNPLNSPSNEERKILLEYDEANRGEGDLKPKIVTGDNSNMYYAPIIMFDMCLKCHGSKEEIVNFDLVKKLYPNDLAYDYKQGDLRGIWSVEFMK